MAKKIMVVDDEPDVRHSIKKVLSKEGFEVITAVDGNDCLAKLRKVKPDLIIMDLMMPGMPVEQVVKKITDVKILYLSVLYFTQWKKELYISRKNVVGYVQKPFDINALLSRVKEVVAA